MAKAFEHTLVEMRDGRVAEQITDEWDALLANVRHTGKAGTMTVIFSVKPSGENGMEVTAKISSKAPREDVGTAFFFVDDAGNLTRTNPKQADLFPRSVPNHLMAERGD
jgi:hypothetical protein